MFEQKPNVTSLDGKPVILEQRCSQVPVPVVYVSTINYAAIKKQERMHSLTDWPFLHISIFMMPWIGFLAKTGLEHKSNPPVWVLLLIFTLFVSCMTNALFFENWMYRRNANQRSNLYKKLGLDEGAYLYDSDKRHLATAFILPHPTDGK